MRVRTWISFCLVVMVVFGVAGCNKLAKGSGKAKCAQVKKGQRYSAVKKIFGRTENGRRGSNLAHVRIWKFSDGRCVVPFSGIGVRREPRWISGSSPAPKKPGPGRLDCEALVKKQKACVDALVKQGSARSLKNVRARIAKLPESVRLRRIAAVEQTRAQLARIMRQQFVGPNVLTTCKRSRGWASKSRDAARSEYRLRACLTLKDCDAYARCYWNIMGANRVGGPAR